MHHVSIRTADIHRAIAFYDALGFTVTERFTTGMTLACWLEGWNGRLELVQVPTPDPPPDPFADEGYVGYYHLSLDLHHRPRSDPPQADDTLETGLPQWLEEFQHCISTLQDRGIPLTPLKILLPPCQQMIGSQIYEVAFIADPDGLPIEVLNLLNPHT